MFFVLDVNGNNLRGNAGSELEGLLGDAVPAIDGNDDERRGFAICGNDGGDTARGQGDLVIVKAYVAEKENQERNEDDGEIRAVLELRDENNENGDARDERAESVDEDALDPVRVAMFFRLVTSHSFIVPSSLAEARVLPSGLNATERIHSS